MFYRQADEAKDATQEVFARAYQRRDQPPTAPRAWLLGIAHYVCLEMRRQHRKQQRPLPPEAPAWAPDPQTLAAASLDLGRLQQCLNTLEPALRSLVVLRFGLGLPDELSLDEIAQAVQMPRATVYRHLRQALTTLHRRFDAC